MLAQLVLPCRSRDRVSWVSEGTCVRERGRGGSMCLCVLEQLILPSRSRDRVSVRACVESARARASVLLSDV